MGAKEKLNDLAWNAQTTNDERIRNGAYASILKLTMPMAVKLRQNHGRNISDHEFQSLHHLAVLQSVKSYNRSFGYSGWYWVIAKSLMITEGISNARQQKRFPNTVSLHTEVNGSDRIVLADMIPDTSSPDPSDLRDPQWSITKILTPIERLAVTGFSFGLSYRELANLATEIFGREFKIKSIDNALRRSRQKCDAISNPVDRLKEVRRAKGNKIHAKKGKRKTATEKSDRQE